jgi:hypothetical protein
LTGPIRDFAMATPHARIAIISITQPIVRVAQTILAASCGRKSARAMLVEQIGELEVSTDSR